MTTIAWDVDDTLNDLMGVWLLEQWRPTHPGCAVTYDDLRSNPPHQALATELKNYLESLDEFRRSRYLEQLAPLPEALHWFERHGGRYRHIALTSVPVSYAPISASWVMRHFGRWIRGFHFVPSPRPGEALPYYDGSKQDFLSWFGKADVLVDDHAGNVEAARGAGVKGVLIPRPWNSASGSLGETFEELAKL